MIQCAAACSTQPPVNRKLSDDFSQPSLLWKITSSSGAESFIFGTIHLADSSVFWQRDTVLTLLRSSKAFYAEIHLDSAFSGLNPTAMLLPVGTSLADFFTAEELAEIRAVLKDRLGPMASMAEQMKPAAIIGLLMLDSVEKTAPMSIDEFLWKQAAAGGCTMGGLERISEQLSLLDSLPPHVLLQVVRSSEQDTMLPKLVRAYASEDLPTIVRLVDSVSVLESFMLSLNDDRNTRMARRMQPALNQGGAFFAVGAAHLGGKQGILAALQDLGYSVVPVWGGRRRQWLTN